MVLGDDRHAIPSEQPDRATLGGPAYLSTAGGPAESNGRSSIVLFGIAVVVFLIAVVGLVVALRAGGRADRRDVADRTDRSTLDIGPGVPSDDASAKAAPSTDAQPLAPAAPVPSSAATSTTVVTAVPTVDAPASGGPGLLRPSVAVLKSIREGASQAEIDSEVFRIQSQFGQTPAVFLSSTYASLRPGYIVVGFTGFADQFAAQQFCLSQGIVEVNACIGVPLTNELEFVPVVGARDPHRAYVNTPGQLG